MADDHHHGNIIIIKKKVSGGHGHHGGAWKIAFADFMTAMMAFFLVLWIINATDKETKTVIARYFNPVKLENLAKAKKGLHGETSVPSDGKEGKDDKPDTGNAVTAKGEKDSKGSPSPPEKKAEAKTAQKGEPINAEAKAEAAESQLFAAPYQALDRIAAAAGGDVAAGASPDKGDEDPQRWAGALSIESFRDPFKPIGPGSPNDPAAFDSDGRTNAAPNIEPGKTGPEDKPQPNPVPSATPGERIASGDAAKAATPPGGLADSGEREEGAKGEGGKTPVDAAKLNKELRERVAAAVKSSAGPDVEARQTKEGLLISVTDKLDFSMFGIGSAEPRAELVHAMEAIAKLIKERPGRIVVRGYTDARPYRNGAYDNWRLSSDRAQMAYYMLTRGGAPAARFSRVEGYADRAPRDPAHPLAAVNRRLEILVEEPKS